MYIFAVFDLAIFVSLIGFQYAVAIDNQALVIPCLFHQVLLELCLSASLA